MYSFLSALDLALGKVLVLYVKLRASWDIRDCYTGTVSVDNRVLEITSHRRYNNLLFAKIAFLVCQLEVIKDTNCNSLHVVFVQSLFYF